MNEKYPESPTITVTWSYIFIYLGLHHLSWVIYLVTHTIIISSMMQSNKQYIDTYLLITRTQNNNVWTNINKWIQICLPCIWKFSRNECFTWTLHIWTWANRTKVFACHVEKLQSRLTARQTHYLWPLPKNKQAKPSLNYFTSTVNKAASSFLALLHCYKISDNKTSQSDAFSRDNKRRTRRRCGFWLTHVNRDNFPLLMWTLNVDKRSFKPTPRGIKTHL